VWALGCLVVEVRAGTPLLATWLASDASVLNGLAALFRKLAKPWWSAWAECALFFHEGGRPADEPCQYQTDI
jgi:serine/threonine-protein kinase SRPK3